VIVRLLRSAWTLAIALTGLATADDKLKDIQSEAVARKADKVARAYHFGSQGLATSSRTTRAIQTA